MPLRPKLKGSPSSGDLVPVEPIPINDYRSNYAGPLEEQSAVLHYWRILRKRTGYVLATLAIVFALSVLVTLRTTRLYRATSKVAIFPETPNVLGFKDAENAFPQSEYDLALETQASILSSDTLALRVIDVMHLAQDSRFNDAAPTAVHAGSPRDSSQAPDKALTAELLRRFHRELNVESVPQTRILDVSYTHPDPQLATEIVNTLIKTFIEENFRTKYESVTQTSEWLSKELADLQLKVETSQEKLVRYQKEHGILGADDKQNIVTAKLDELNKELTAAETDRIQKQSDYTSAMQEDAGTASDRFSTGGGNSLLDKLREKEADLDTQYAQMTTQFGAGYPKVAELSNQLQQVRAEIAAEQARTLHRLRDQYLAAVQREKSLTAAFEQQKQAANALNESAIEYSVLKHDADSNRQLYEGLLQKLKEASISAGLRSDNIRVVDIAQTPTSPVTPNVPRNLGFGLLLGLGLGIGLALVMDNLDTTVRNAEEIGAICELPNLAVIPLQAWKNGRLPKRLAAVFASNESREAPSLITFAQPKSQAAESFRAFRTSIVLSALGTPPKVILVTSAWPQEGKTTVSANLALVMAQRGTRVLLVDADFRKPGVGQMFGIKSNAGLSTLISGVDQPEEVIVPSSQIPNLSIVAAGPLPPQPAELLGSQVMRDYITHWRNQFDHIIIDTPACLSVTDAVLLSPEADQVILVARSGQTTKAALRRACEVLQQVNASVMGVVLNAYDMNSLDSYYYSYRSRNARYYEES